MDYIRQYKSFVSGHYLSEGVRITAGVVLPALSLNHFNLLPVGIVVSLGAMSVSITDNPGPIHHRKNGMIACVIINTLTALLTGFAAPFPVVLGFLILVACFSLSMIGVFGTRVNSIGVSGLLILVLNIDRMHYGWDVVWNAGYILAGGTWYLLLSLLLYSFRPYKLAQQALGDCIISTADYLRVRTAFYQQQADYESIYQRMMEQQVLVHQKQELVRELLFKSRFIIKESTTMGRTLVMIFTDTVDLFERTMSTFHDYKKLHEVFGNERILQDFHEVVLLLANELDEIGIAVKSGRPSEENPALFSSIGVVKKYFEKLRDEGRTAENVDAFISMRHILNSIEDIAGRIHTLHLYTRYDKNLFKQKSLPADYEQFITHQSIDLKLIFDNLSLRSNTFRHALRVSIATFTGFVISLFLSVGHSYWILLTIIVILKPAYSLTKKRNYQRLAGTILGALAGLIIIYFIHDNEWLFIIMLLLMIGTYSLLRTNYMISVIFMTPYILLLFHLLSDTPFNTIILDRIIDTAIGSGIAFLANIILLPAWEQDQITGYMQQAIISNKNYFADVANAFTGNPVTNTMFKVSRKNSFVALANLSDAFTRMLSEPKSKQRNAKKMHQFVVLNHMLSSHIAALSSYVMPLSSRYSSPDFVPVVQLSIQRMEQAALILTDPQPVENTDSEFGENPVQQRLQRLLETRRQELQDGKIDTVTKSELTEFKPIADQFNFIEKIAADINKTSAEWVSG